MIVFTQYLTIFLLGHVPSLLLSTKSVKRISRQFAVWRTILLQQIYLNKGSPDVLRCSGGNPDQIHGKISIYIYKRCTCCIAKPRLHFRYVEETNENLAVGSVSSFLFILDLSEQSFNTYFAMELKIHKLCNKRVVSYVKSPVYKYICPSTQSLFYAVCEIHYNNRPT